MRGWRGVVLGVVGGSIVVAAGGCSGGGSGGGAAGESCASEATCATYGCACADGTTSKSHGCVSGACTTANDACAGCEGHGGSTGEVTTTPPAGGSSSSSGGMDGGALDDCEQVNQQYGCHKPVRVAPSSVALAGSTCNATTLVTCGPECPGANANTHCCPKGTNCVEDYYALSQECPGGTGVAQRRYLCVPDDVELCNYTLDERKAAGLGVATSYDLGCKQHGYRRIYSCAGHGSESTTKCVPSYDNTDGNAVLCPEQAATCTPTEP